MSQKSIFAVTCLSLLLFACQTSSKTKIAQMDKVQVGMDKAEVLHTTGFSPRFSDRKNGQDRWVFEVYPERHSSATVSKEVRFEGGKVIYVGEVQKPAVTAEEQDRLNNSKIDNVAIEDSIKREERKKSIDLKEELAGSMPKKPKFEEVIPVDEKPDSSQ